MRVPRASILARPFDDLPLRPFHHGGRSPLDLIIPLSSRCQHVLRIIRSCRVDLRAEIDRVADDVRLAPLPFQRLLHAVDRQLEARPSVRQHLAEVAVTPEAERRQVVEAVAKAHANLVLRGIRLKLKPLLARAKVQRWTSLERMGRHGVDRLVVWRPQRLQSIWTHVRAIYCEPAETCADEMDLRLRDARRQDELRLELGRRVLLVPVGAGAVGLSVADPRQRSQWGLICMKQADGERHRQHKKTRKCMLFHAAQSIKSAVWRKWERCLKGMKSYGRARVPVRLSSGVGNDMLIP